MAKSNEEMFFCPMRNSSIEKITRNKLSLYDPIAGSHIISYSDSLVFPAMNGIVVKKLITQHINCLILKHNDTISSVYSQLDELFVDVNDAVNINQPIGIARKNKNRWEMQFSIWNKLYPMNTDSILICDNNK